MTIFRVKKQLFLTRVTGYTTFVGPPKSGFQPAAWWLSSWSLGTILGSTPREPGKCPFCNEILLTNYTAFADTAKSGFLPAAGAQALVMPQVLRLVADQQR